MRAPLLGAFAESERAKELGLRDVLILCSGPWNAIPTPVRTALQLFETDLAHVNFAEIDAETLARAVSEVNALAGVVATAQAALDSARNALQERQDALLGQVQRALAYARVYAENDEALTQRLNAIALPRSGRVARAKDDAGLVLSSAPQPTTRGRRRRAVQASDSLLAGCAPGGGTSVEVGTDEAAARAG